MRFVHTSDWHLGRTFGGQSLHAEQEAFLGWLVDVVRAEQASLVIVAGDVYDRSIPAADTVALFGWALQSLRAAGAEVVVIAGNHDSAERLGAYDDLTDLAGVYIRGGYRRAGSVLHLAAADGPLDVAAVPFLEPALAPPDAADAPSAEADDPAREGNEGGSGRLTHRAVLQRAIDTARRDRRAPRSIAVAHAFVAGATSSESERTLTVGGSALVPAALFEGFSYAALGHLHKPQAFSDTVRYSGSPLPYSFGEQHAKQVLVVELDPDGASRVRPVAVGPGRRVATVRGPIDDVLADPRHAAAEGCWVRAVLTDATYVLDAKSRLQRRFPHVVEVVLDPERPAAAGERIVATGRGQHSPLHNAVDFWQAITGATAPRSVVEALATALDEARLALGDGRHDLRAPSVSVEDLLATGTDGALPIAIDAPPAAPPDRGAGRAPTTTPTTSTDAPAAGRRRRPPAAQTPSLFDDTWDHAS